VVDARRGEVFVAGYLTGEEPSNELDSPHELISPRALPPGEVGDVLVAGGAPWLAIGDGAVRYREQLESTGATVPGDGSPLHRVSAEAICELGARVTVASSQIEAILPDYRRRPDAEIALEGASR
jgi:tRNA threonylcarbamoyladenosine biosynthesis protein TsaB